VRYERFFPESPPDARAAALRAGPALVVLGSIERQEVSRSAREDVRRVRMHPVLRGIETRTERPGKVGIEGGAKHDDDRLVASEKCALQEFP
jgi:hypothetical protein